MFRAVWMFLRKVQLPFIIRFMIAFTMFHVSFTAGLMVMFS